MVLEQIYHSDWLKNHPYAAFLLGIAYSILGLTGALLIYPKDPAILAVAIIAILFLPSLYRLTLYEEAVERKSAGLKIMNLLKNNKQLIKVYSFAFLGILFSFSFFSIVLPVLATNVLFKAQLSVLQGAAISAGGAIFTTSLFWEIFLNNLKVLIFCFLISLIAGNGSMLLIAWNASVWGTVFGTLAKTAASVGGANPWVFFTLVMLSVLPHTILEMLAYVVGTISGTTISEGFVKEKLSSQKFMNVVMRSMVLLLISIVILVVAGVVETYVLGNFDTYRTIIQISFGQ